MGSFKRDQKEPAKKIMEKFETSEQVNEAFAILNTYWDDLAGTLSCRE